MMDEAVNKRLLAAYYAIGKDLLQEGKGVSIEEDEGQIIIKISDGRYIQINFVIIDPQQQQLPVDSKEKGE